MRFKSRGAIHLGLIIFFLLMVGAGIFIGTQLLGQYRLVRYGRPEFGDNPFISGSEELKTCMKEVIGEKAFAEIAQNKRPPTEDETKNLEVCWPEIQGRGSQENPFADASEETRKCLRQAVGDAAFKEISQRKRAPTAEEEGKLRACFEQQMP